MARKKAVIATNFNVFKDGKLVEYKKDDEIRLSLNKYNNWLKNNLIK